MQILYRFSPKSGHNSVILFLMLISFHTLGCKLNFAETSAIGKVLIERGHRRAGKSDIADICVINTCSVTDAADHKGRQLIHRLHRENPNATIIVTGCYAQLQPEEIAEIDGVDYVIGNNEKFDIANIIDEIEKANKQPLSVQPQQKSTISESQIHISSIRQSDIFHPSLSSTDRTRCFLKVQDGCNYFCTYCTIPMARGKSRNPEIRNIVEMAQQAIASGMKEIVLTGVNIGDFGRSTGETFFDLIRALDSIDGNIRYRISSIEPNLLSDEIIDFVAKSRHFTPHFHIPLQSGTDEMLRLIKRRYDTSLFSERIAHIKSVMPHAFIGVDVMVGLRGETPELFELCRQYIDSLEISQLHVFTYSERANTKMLEVEYVVPAKERKRRSDILHKLSTEKLQHFYASQKGRKATVLWEGKQQNENGQTMMSGFTENYIRVMAPYNKQKINTFEEIII